MDIQFTGKIIAALPIVQGQSKRDGSQWVKGEFVIEELNQRYLSRCAFQIFGADKLQQMNIQAGEVLTVHLGIRANQSQEGRWFNQLDCWRVDRYNAQPAQGYQQPPQQNTAPENGYQPQAQQQGYQQPQQQQMGGQPSGAYNGNLPFPPR